MLMDGTFTRKWTIPDKIVLFWQVGGGGRAWESIKLAPGNGKLKDIPVIVGQ